MVIYNYVKVELWKKISLFSCFLVHGPLDGLGELGQRGNHHKQESGAKES
jgi:hypothetical protein